MTDKQTLFIEHYLTHFNATKGAIEAGYSDSAVCELPNLTFQVVDAKKYLRQTTKGQAY